MLLMTLWVLWQMVQMEDASALNNYYSKKIFNNKRFTSVRDLRKLSDADWKECGLKMAHRNWFKKKIDPARIEVKS